MSWEQWCTFTDNDFEVFSFCMLALSVLATGVCVWKEARKEIWLSKSKDDIFILDVFARLPCYLIIHVFDILLHLIDTLQDLAHKLLMLFVRLCFSFDLLCVFFWAHWFSFRVSSFKKRRCLTKSKTLCRWIRCNNGWIPNQITFRITKWGSNADFNCWIVHALLFANLQHLHFSKIFHSFDAFRHLFVQFEVVAGLSYDMQNSFDRVWHHKVQLICLLQLVPDLLYLLQQVCGSLKLVLSHKLVEELSNPLSYKVAWLQFPTLKVFFKLIQLCLHFLLC